MGFSVWPPLWRRHIIFPVKRGWARQCSIPETNSTLALLCNLSVRSTHFMVAGASACSPAINHAMQWQLFQPIPTLHVWQQWGDCSALHSDYDNTIFLIHLRLFMPCAHLPAIFTFLVCKPQPHTLFPTILYFDCAPILTLQTLGNCQHSILTRGGGTQNGDHHTA